MNPVSNTAHGFLRPAQIFLRSEFPQTLLARQLDIDTDPVRIFSRFFDQSLRSLGNRFEVNVAAKIVCFPQLPRDPNDLLHRVIGVTDDAAAEKEPFDVVPLVEVQRELDRLLRRHSRPLNIRRAPVDAVVAVVDADVREENLQQRNASPVRRIRVANPAPAR